MKPTYEELERERNELAAQLERLKKERYALVESVSSPPLTRTGDRQCQQR